MAAPVEVLAGLVWLRDAPALPDAALAGLLGLEPRALDALVAAQPARFAEETVYRLTGEERTAIPGAPVLAFTEAGVALLMGQLPGRDGQVLALLPRLAEARRLLTSQAELAARVAALEEKLDLLLRSLQGEEEEGAGRRPIGFVAPEDLPHHLKDRARERP